MSALCASASRRRELAAFVVSKHQVALRAPTVGQRGAVAFGQQGGSRAGPWRRREYASSHKSRDQDLRLGQNLSQHHASFGLRPSIGGPWASTAVTTSPTASPMGHLETRTSSRQGWPSEAFPFIAAYGCQSKTIAHECQDVPAGGRRVASGAEMMEHV